MESSEADAVYNRFILDVDTECLEDQQGSTKNHWPDMADPMWQNKAHSCDRAKPYKESVDSLDTPYDNTLWIKPSAEREREGNRDSGRVG